jgi:hypothetical protein
MMMNEIESLHTTLVGLQAQLDSVAGDPGDRETVLKTGRRAQRRSATPLLSWNGQAVEALRSGADNREFWQFQFSVAATAYGVAYTLEHVAAADSEQEMTSLLVMAATALTGVAVGAKKRHGALQ